MPAPSLPNTKRLRLCKLFGLDSVCAFSCKRIDCYAALFRARPERPPEAAIGARTAPGVPGFHPGLGPGGPSGRNLRPSLANARIRWRTCRQVPECELARPSLTMGCSKAPHPLRIGVVVVAGFESGKRLTRQGLKFVRKCHELSSRFSGGAVQKALDHFRIASKSKVDERDLRLPIERNRVFVHPVRDLVGIEQGPDRIELSYRDHDVRAPPLRPSRLRGAGALLCRSWRIPGNLSLQPNGPAFFVLSHLPMSATRSEERLGSPYHSRFGANPDPCITPRARRAYRL